MKGNVIVCRGGYKSDYNPNTPGEILYNQDYYLNHGYSFDHYT